MGSPWVPSSCAEWLLASLPGALLALTVGPCCSPTGDLVPRAHRAVSGDTLSCHNWGATGISWAEAGGAARHLAVPRNAHRSRVSLETGLEREPFVGHVGLDASSPLCLLQNPDNQIVQTSKEMRTSNHCPTVSALPTCPAAHTSL